MNAIATVLLGFLLLVLTQQLLGVALFVWYCRQSSPPTSDGELPEAMVVLAVRGAEPTLPHCVRALAAQAYPRYTVRIVVDSEQDPAWKLVHEVLSDQDAPHVHVGALADPASTCSLKCSALYQATASLPESCEVVVTVDSDVVPHATWLRELVAPLRDPRVGATFGNRWYAPIQGQWGSLVRYLWNCAVVLTMHYNKVPWGGSLAARASMHRDTALRQRWLQAGCEDLPLVAILRQQRLALRFVPSVLMVDREECPLPDCLRFIQRQLLWTRLYTPAAWWLGFLTYLLITVAQLAVLLLTPFAILDGNGPLAALMLASVLAYFVLNYAQVVVLQRNTRRLLPHADVRVKLGVRALVAIPLTQFCSVWTCWRSLRTRRITWRGVDYEIDGPWHIRMVEYKPYEADSGIADRRVQAE